MAADVDDFRVGQYQVDQCRREEVVRHLVDEEWTAELAVDSRQLEVFLAQRPQFGAVQPFKNCRIISSSAIQPDDEVGNVGQLGGSFDRGMARQDLFEKRRARTRQSDNENGIGRGRADACTVAKNAVVKRILHC